MIGSPSLTETAFLVGAGVSIDAPSCIPAARPIIARIFQWLAAGDDHLASRLTGRSEPGSAFCPFDFLRFEAVLEAVSRETPQIIRLLHVLETWGSPNLSHLFLARAASKGSPILTTNFDTRLEMAAAWSGNEAPLFLLSPRQNVPPPEARIVKLHGSFPDFQRGGSHLPRGTLTQIGAIGLAFEHLPGFVAWFEAMSRGRTLVVMGYSASDSFDVVPLIEDRWAGDQVIWFDFTPGARRVRGMEVTDGDDCIVPKTPTTDFVGLSLARLKHRQPDCRVWRVRGGGVAPFLSWLFGPSFQRFAKTTQKMLAKLDTVGFADRNLEALHVLLESLDMQIEERRDIARRLIEEDAFGDNLTAPTGVSTVVATEGHEPPDQQPDEDEPPDEPLDEPDAYSAVVSLHKISGDLLAAEKLCDRLIDEAGGDPLIRQDLVFARSYILLENKRVAEGFALMERNMLAVSGGRLTGGAADVLLMYADGEFSMCYDQGDHSGMKRARGKLRKVARKAGSIWGMALWHLFTARELEVRLRVGVSDGRYFETLEEGRRHGEIAAYFFLRTGRLRFYIQAMRLLAYFLGLLGQRGAARDLARRSLTWIPDEAVEDRLVCLCNSVSLAVDDGDLVEARRMLRLLRRRPTVEIPDHGVLVALASAEVAMAEGRPEAVERRLAEAEARLARLDADHWNHAGNIAAARNKARRITPVPPP